MEIKNLQGEVIYTIDGNTLRGAYLRGANLEGANLRGAYLEGANLEDAKLEDAKLEDANLRGADFEGAYLEGAYLEGAYLRGANLEGANLRGANLRGANLRGANLEDANLEDANLEDANLEDANLRGAYLRRRKLEHLPKQFIELCSRDILFVLSHLKSEVPHLKKMLVDGKIDGTQYEGECGCLIGTLGHGKDKKMNRVCQTIPFYSRGMHNHGEQWFWNIREGDTPENSDFSAHVLQLIEMIENE